MTTSRSVLEKTLVALQALQERGISAKREEVKALFDDPKDGKNATIWVEECLTEATLLSKEEAALYVQCLP
jgi:hypothetical protein